MYIYKKQQTLTTLYNIRRSVILITFTLKSRAGQIDRHEVSWSVSDLMFRQMSPVHHLPLIRILAGATESAH